LAVSYFKPSRGWAARVELRRPKDWDERIRQLRWRSVPCSCFGVLITLAHCRVRQWRADDLDSLVRHANNRAIWLNLRDRFPHPYRDEDGRGFLSFASALSPSTLWAIEVDGAAVGGIGLELHSDVERVSAEIGYWLGQEFWGRGLMTDVVRAVTAQVFRDFELTRLYALPFAENIGSIRVLEKAGYVLEGRMRHAVIKDGVVRDQAMYAAYRL
jgi:[ribosomal protein S5]-alanine N-acetyltransferase